MERERSESVDSDETQRLRAAVHYAVGCLCEEVGKDKEREFSKQAVACISEITFRQCENFAKDLEMFARHAKRTTVNVEDVKLLARRSNALRAIKKQPTDDRRSIGNLRYISQRSEELALNNLEQKEKKKKKAASKKARSTSDEQVVADSENSNTA